MANPSSNNFVNFTLDTREAFSRYVRESPNNRRVLPSDKAILIDWLTDSRRPQSQEEFSRRNYVRKAFKWEEESGNLLAVPKKDGDKHRLVVTTDMIADVVDMVHHDNSHAGWDTTWEKVSTSYYGILRADVIFLLKQCQNKHCSQNPSKRPKGSAPTLVYPLPIDHEFSEYVNPDDEQDISLFLDVPQGDMSGVGPLDWDVGPY